MAKAVATRSIDLESIDRLEEKIKLLVSLVERLRASEGRLSDENARLVRELDTALARLTAAEGSGAEREDRLVYAEGLCDVDSTRHIVDQRASNLLFGDRRRLQEDLLADAASTEVRKLFPKVRGCPSGAHRRAQ